MKLPPKGDPMRRLIVAGRSTQGLGIIQLLIGPLLYAMIAWQLEARGKMICGVIVFLPGLFFVICGVFIHRRHGWAIITAIVLASLQGIFLLLMIAGLLVQGSIGGADLEMFAVALIIACILAGYIVLIVLLARSFSILKADRIDFDRGFVPVLTAQAEEPNDEQLTTDH